VLTEPARRIWRGPDLLFVSMNRHKHPHRCDSSWASPLIEAGSMRKRGEIRGCHRGGWTSTLTWRRQGEGDHDNTKSTASFDFESANNHPPFMTSSGLVLIAGVVLRLTLFATSIPALLERRPELSTPLTSVRSCGCD
jgi:hypothetical protein